ncbi:hypothetical protein H1R20_g5727, partial [Candolleomyces eurysporus]
MTVDSIVSPLEPPLPEYELDETQTLPTYSTQARSTECLLQFEPPRRTGCPACEWIFETKCMKVNLGRKIWKLNSPTYGSNGVIDGSIQFPDLTHPLDSLHATIEGRLRMACPERKGSMDEGTLVFLRYTVPVEYNPDLPESTFSIPIPPTFHQAGKNIPCPPSFFFAESKYIVEVSYQIRFDAVWKTKRKQKLESRIVGFYYLPKTSPVIPPLCILPPASRHRENPPLFLEGPDRMSSFPIPPSFHTNRTLTKCQTETLKRVSDSVYLSIPVPGVFTAGQEIPFMISLSFNDDPCMSELLCQNMAIHLFKRVGIVGRGGHADSERNSIVSSAVLKKNSGWAEGVVVIKGSIRAGDAGAECSWSVSGCAYVKYVLRVSISPPSTLVNHIPTFVHEEELGICTSSWGVVDRELVSGGGKTTPAVGLSSSLRRIY